MAPRSRVAVLRTKPETVLADIEKLVNLAGVRDALAPSATTILKDNISWHFPFPGANTTPWQLEGTILALRNAGFADQVCVQNKTVVTNAFKGEDLNHYVPIFKKYDIPVRYNFRDADMTWIEYKPKAKMLVLDKIFPEGIRIPDYFVGKNIVHLPTTKCVAGDTEVVLADGSVMTVRELVDAAAAHGERLEADGDERYPGSVSLFAMDAAGAVRPHPVSWFWRTTRGGRRVVRMRTKTGRTLTATEEHPVWTPYGWRSLASLVAGDRVAIARRIAVRGCPQTLPALPAEAPFSLPEPRVARDLIATLRRADTDRGFGPAIDALAALASEDLAWDPIVEISEVREPIDLYDLTVPGVANFIANGIVVHNCHIYTTTTGAMKNAFGGLLSTKRHYTHSWIHATLVDLLAIQKEIHTGLFAVMDGTTAGNGPGPRTMFPVVKNMMLAGADQVAIDAVAAKLMGFDPMTLDFIRLAHEAKLGVGDPRDIEVVGDDIANENWHFRVGDNSASRVGDLMWFGPLKSLQNLFFRTPLVHAFIFGSEAYHDLYRWPAKDRQTFEKWRRETPWGQLFSTYSETPAAKI